MRKPLLLLVLALFGSSVAIACSGSDTDLSATTADGEDEELAKLQACGGFAGLTCGSGKTCVDDPRDSCNPGKGGRDCGGVCVDSKKTARCGGIAGLVCKFGQACVDDPKDTCNPAAGGRDCMGFCVNVQTGNGPHCPTIRCASGFHCEEKGINGGSIGVCLKNSAPESACPPCAAGSRCEESTGQCQSCQRIGLFVTCKPGTHFDFQACACK